MQLTKQDIAQLRTEISKGKNQYKIYENADRSLEQLEGVIATIEGKEKLLSKLESDTAKAREEYEDAAKSVQDAKDEAAATKAAGKQKAADYLEAERKKIAEERAELATEKKEHDDLLDKTRSDIQDAGNELTSLQDKITEAQSTLSNLEAERKKILKGFGG